MKIAVVQGTRPEIIKNYAIVRSMRRRQIPHVVLHTNQHLLPEMRDLIYRQMGYRPHDILSRPYRLGTAIDWLQDVYIRDKVSHVLVNGDTAASLAGALAGMYLKLPVSHVEAGLRARDPLMNEERNRIIVDAVASYLFAYTDFEYEMLRASPDVRGQVYVEGNTTVDVIHDFRDRIEEQPVPDPFVFSTMHRQEFTDSAERMGVVFSALSEISRDHCPVVLPLHPRTQDAVGRLGLQNMLRDMRVIPPIGVFQALSYQKHASVVITDSGCVQEEAYLLGTPCLTIRENTERHLTVKYGANRITGFKKDDIVNAYLEVMKQKSQAWPPVYGEPGVGDRIVSRIVEQSERPQFKPERGKISTVELLAEVERSRETGFEH